MLYEHRRPDVAVFIDFENVYVSVRDKLDANPNFETIMERCNDLGRVVIARAYADWYRYPRITSALYANSIEPMYVPTYYYDKEMGRTGRAIKNSVDMNLCIDTMKTLFGNTNIGKFVLVTGDRDFIPLVNSIRQHGKEVIVIGIGGAASAHLAQCADEFIFYEQLIGKTTAATKHKEKSERAVASNGSAAREQQQEPDVYDVLVDAVHLVRERGYVSTLGSLKLVMKELMGGDFKESRYKDMNGRSFTKFKEFVQDAERRGKVQIYTNGTVNEVFLPGEDPLKLSQFAEDYRTEETSVENDVDTATAANGQQKQEEDAASQPDAELKQPPPAPNNRSRRRRRARNNQRQTSKSAEETTPTAEEAAPTEEPAEAEAEALQQEPPAQAEAEAEAEAPQQEPPAAEQVPTEEMNYYNTVFEDMVSLGAEDRQDEVLADLFAKSQQKPHDDTLFDRILANQFGRRDEADEADESGEAEAPETPAEGQEAPPLAEVVEHEQPAEVQPVSDEVPEATRAETSPSDVDFFNQAEAETLAEAEPEAPAEAPAVPEAEPAQAEAPAAEPVQAEAPAADAAADEQQITFTEEEWDVFRAMMGQFSKPVSFSQIVDTLKDLRNNHQKLDRRNEQLRTMVKQAIHNGMLERSGRGSRIYYKLKTDDTD